ncbi:hypothetical protein [Acinetobacter phage BUCT628]|nr:hypothetical protein [Acinetobacter phage BUCT628]
MKKKVIKITLTLQDGVQTFTAEGDNRLSSTGLAISTNITYGNGAISPTAQITVYGLPLPTMIKLMRIQWNTMQAILNMVKIEVGEQGQPLKVAYEGNITFATINMDGAPNVALVITSQMAVVEKMRPIKSITIGKDEEKDVVDVIRDICAEINYEFYNYGFSKIITSTTLNGSGIEIIEKLSHACGFDLYIEQRSVSICPIGGSRELKIPIISPKTGLIGYPAPDQRGITFSCAYDPLVRFGGIVQIRESIIGDVVNQDWRVYGLVATLEANIPQGKWQMNVNATWRNSKDAAVQR